MCTLFTNLSYYLHTNTHTVVVGASSILRDASGQPWGTSASSSSSSNMRRGGEKEEGGATSSRLQEARQEQQQQQQGGGGGGWTKKGSEKFASFLRQMVGR